MRTILPAKVERGRIMTGAYGSAPGAPYGAVKVFGPCGSILLIMATDGISEAEVWEHVSVSTERRCPNWEEMSAVKDWFWNDDECVVQFHPPKSEHINNHPFCLHLWRRPGHPFALPPALFVGDKALGEL
jgi:hypothetical protein